MSRLLAILAVALLTACEGDTGPTGPEGPQGPQGETGAAGPAGAVDAFDLIEKTITAADYTTSSGLLIFDGRVSVDSYLETYVSTGDLPFPAYVTLADFASRQLPEGTAAPYVAVFDGGLVVTDVDKVLVGRTLVVAVLPQ